jgi:hypothetical protein
MTPKTDMMNKYNREKIKACKGDKPEKTQGK